MGMISRRKEESGNSDSLLKGFVVFMKLIDGKE